MKDKKKTILVIALVAGAIIIISGIGIYFGYHTWDEATCSKPKTCSICGKTEGKHWGINGETQHVRNHKSVLYVIKQRARS